MNKLTTAHVLSTHSHNYDYSLAVATWHKISKFPLQVLVFCTHKTTSSPNSVSKWIQLTGGAWVTMQKKKMTIMDLSENRVSANLYPNTSPSLGAHPFQTTLHLSIEFSFRTQLTWVFPAISSPNWQIHSGQPWMNQILQGQVWLSQIIPHYQFWGFLKWGYPK